MTGPAAGTGFRNDINGLRAWAVGFVILYHFAVPGFDGGFVGVDIFFVISGYLMTAIVQRGLARGDFSVAGFYLARAKRIVPALAVLCAVLLTAGWFLLLPPDYKTLSTHSVYSLSFLSNVEYWQEAGYFDIASHEKWLLHTWSLSVEWQFYLILPVLLWAVWRLKPGLRAQRIAIIACLLMSLAASVVLTMSQASAAFFLLHTRAWEMLVGGLVAVLPQAQRLPHGQRRWIDAAGLVLILLSVALFDKHSPWPGWRATVPVGAATLVLLANRNAGWTGNRLAQWIGDRSYSLYLWHWPVYVTLVYIEYRFKPAAIAAGIALTFVLGHLSYRFVENSSRAALGTLRKPLSTALLGGAALLVAVPAIAVWKQHGVSGRFDPAAERAAAQAANINPRKMQCQIMHGVVSPACVYGTGAGRVIVIGDSHADSIVSALAASQHDAAVIEWSYSGCPFAAGMKRTPADAATKPLDYRCGEFIEWATAQSASSTARTPVVIVSRYASAAFGAQDGRLDGNTPLVYFSTVAARTDEKFLDEFSAAITTAACNLARQRPVYLMRPIPEIGVDVPKTLARRLTFGIAGEVTVPMEEYKRRNGWVWKAQDAAVARCGVKILDPLPYLCRNGQCYGSKDGQPLYHDDNHLSEFGNRQLVPMFRAVK